MSHARAAARAADGTVMQRRVLQRVVGGTPGRSAHPISGSVATAAAGPLAGVGPAFRLTPLEGVAGGTSDGVIQAKTLTTGEKRWRGIDWQITAGESQVNRTPVELRGALGDSILATATVTAHGGDRDNTEVGFVQNTLNVAHRAEYRNGDKRVAVTEQLATPLWDTDGKVKAPWFNGKSYGSVSDGSADIELVDGPRAFLPPKRTFGDKEYTLDSMIRRVDFGYWVVARQGQSVGTLQKGGWYSTWNGTGGELAGSDVSDDPLKYSGATANSTPATETITELDLAPAKEEQKKSEKPPTGKDKGCCVIL